MHKVIDGVGSHLPASRSESYTHSSTLLGKTHAVSISLVKSSTSPGCACSHTSLKSMFATRNCGLVCHARKKFMDESASQRYLDAVKAKGDSKILYGAAEVLDAYWMKGVVV